MRVYALGIKVLEGWKFESNYQFPELVKSVTKELNLTDERDLKEVDAHVRYFVRKNPNYKAKRGAHGGIALASTEAQREAAKAARLQAKADAAAKVEATLAASTSSTPAVTDESDISDEAENV